MCIFKVDLSDFPIASAIWVQLLSSATRPLLVWQVAWEQFLSSSHYLFSPHWFLLKATELPQQLLKTDAQIIKYLTSYTN